MEAPRDDVFVGRPEAPVPGHLVPLPGEQWALWEWVCVRGAGFPVSEVLRLASEECAAAADRLLAAEEEAERQREAALAAVRQDLDGCTEEERERRVKMIRRLKKGALPATAEPESLGFAAALAEVETRRRLYLEAFAAAQADLSLALRRAAENPRLREALTWQNRHALATGFDALLRRPEGEGRRDSQERQHEQLVASYLHRYCTKNDTIGFFGPVGWARATAASDGTIDARPGADLVAQRQVFFETWCIDAVAEALAGDKPLRPWLTPRKLPFFFLQGSVYVPFEGTPSQLSPAELAVFAACTGRQTALELADRLIADPALALGSRDEVFALLESLAARQMIVWQMEVPMDLDGEGVLARILGRIEDAALREPLLSELAELVERRDAVAAAAGDPERLGRALAALEERFEELTGKDSRRFQGTTYAGRNLVYEDCRRDLEMELGTGFLEALGPPLSLVLMSVRWLGAEISRRYREEFQRAYAELRVQTGAGTVSLLQFIQQVRPVLLEINSSLVSEAAEEHRRRWAEILDLPPGERRVRFSSDQLRPRVEAAFAAQRPGWMHARQHSPDLLVRAESLEAVRRGEFELVLGEVHLATNTLRTALFVAQHPSPEELRQAMLADIPDPTVIPWLPKKREGKGDKGPLGFVVPPATARLDFGLLSNKDLRLALDVDPPSDPDATNLFLGDMVVTAHDGELVVRTRDGAHSLAIVDFFEIAFSAQAINSFRILPRRPYAPRITIDKLIVQREMWRTPLRGARFPLAKTEEERFLEARRFMRRHGMPRFVFVRTPYENKPFFVDFASPVAVEILARACRRALEKGGEDVRIGVSEMIPEPDQAWLPDAQGQRHTCELRLVAVDRSGGPSNDAGESTT